MEQIKDKDITLDNDLNVYKTISQYLSIYNFFITIYEKTRISTFDDLIIDKPAFEKLLKELSNLIKQLDKITKRNDISEKKILKAYYFLNEYFNSNEYEEIEHKAFQIPFSDNLNDAALSVIDDLQNFWINQEHIPLSTQHRMTETKESLRPVESTEENKNNFPRFLIDSAVKLLSGQADKIKIKSLKVTLGKDFNENCSLLSQSYDLGLNLEINHNILKAKLENKKHLNIENNSAKHSVMNSSIGEALILVLKPQKINKLKIITKNRKAF